MSNIFNVQRFGKLFRKHSIENYKSYLMSLIVLCGTMTLFYAFTYFIVEEHTVPMGNRIGALLVFYLLGGIIFTSTIFADYGSREKAISTLTLPASHFEKFLIGWLYSFVIFIGIFLVCFFTIDTLFAEASVSSEADKNELAAFFRANFYDIFFYYAVLHSFMFYCAIFFEKLHFIKAACILFIILIIVLAIHNQLIKSLIPNEINISPGRPFGRVRFGDEGNFIVDLKVSTTALYNTILYVGLSLTLWFASYFRLKEKQI